MQQLVGGHDAMQPVVLIVDDDPRNCELLGRLLELEGARVIAALDVGDGLELARRDRPDAVLLDVRMPGIDGVTACRDMRARPAFAALPIYLVTAFDDSDVWQQAEAAGASGLMSKPYDRVALRRLVASLRGTSPDAPGAA
jgi:CheY-like chemotaxis protein